MSTENEMDFNVPELNEILKLQREVQAISKSIIGAFGLQKIFKDNKDSIRAFLNVEAVQIFILDAVKNELYTRLSEGGTLKEERLPVSNRSIPGFVASTGNTVNVSDAYNTKELENTDIQLSHNTSWDKRTGIRTKDILAIPIIYSGEIMGVIQIINKKSGSGKFISEEPVLLREIADALGIAIYNLSKRKKSKFDTLISQGLIKEKDIESAAGASRQAKVSIEEYLIKTLKVPKEDILWSLSEFYNCPYAQYDDKLPIPSHLLKNLKKEYLVRELWVPLEQVQGGIRIAMESPGDIIKKDSVVALLKSRAIVYNVALASDIQKYIDRFFNIAEDKFQMEDILGKGEAAQEDSEDEKDSVTESDSQIMNIVNKIINDAYAIGSSDIHIEPDITDKTVNVRYRVDGACALYQTLPFSYRNAIISRIKIMSNLDITVKRIPQDGKIKFKDRNIDIELRVATVPTQGNVEDVVMRILAKGMALPLENMGLTDANYREFVKVMEKPYGLVLVVGPTGSGKTTTLHAALGNINKPDRKIWTAEDPVEITQRGIRQVQVNPRIGFDFATAMRAFLRADPDVIMVGEMRDFETAKIGVEASLTGHLVFSTLHTNSAAETITRLLDIGIDPLNFADSLLGILAQRLVKTLCKQCKRAYNPSLEMYEEIANHFGKDMFAKLKISYSNRFILYQPQGCEACNNTGYKGRMGIHELLVKSPGVRRSIQKRESVEEISRIAIEEGMRTLMQDGILKVIQGNTDMIQVLRVCMQVV